MAKYVALQDILHNGRMHSPGEVIDCPDPKLANAWIANKAVKAVDSVVDAPVAHKKAATKAPITPEGADVNAAPVTTGTETATTEPDVVTTVTADVDTTETEEAPTDSETATTETGPAAEAESASAHAEQPPKLGRAPTPKK